MATETNEFLTRLRRDHENFYKLIHLIGAHLEKVHEAAAADFDLMRDAMTYLTHYPELTHHPLEDEMSVMLRSKDAAFTELGDRLAEEHQSLAEHGHAFLEMLSRVVDGGLVDRQLLEQTGRDYVERQRNHIVWEERDLYPEVAKLFEAADWTLLKSYEASHTDPLFGPVLAKDYASLLSWIERESA